MKVLHVIPRLRKDEGGPARSSQGLVAALRNAGIDAELFTLDGSKPWISGVKSFDRSLDGETVKRYDIVHIHELWNPGLHRVARLCRKAEVPYVISPRGMLDPPSLARKGFKKAIARFLYQDRDLKRACALHVTASKEAEHVRGLGFKNHLIVAPNGVNLPEAEQMPARERGKVRRVLYVGRMHEQKGVENLIRAWSKIRLEDRVDAEGWKLELVYTAREGVERDFERSMKQLVETLGIAESVEFTGALSDEAKWSAYARANLTVLPSYSENFGMVVVESLWMGVPVVTTKGTPWACLENTQMEKVGGGRAGWWIDVGVDALATTLRECLALSDERLEDMGKVGHALVSEKYTWKSSVVLMKHGYEQVLNTCEHAPCDGCPNYGDTCRIR